MFLNWGIVRRPPHQFAARILAAQAAADHLRATLQRNSLADIPSALVDKCGPGTPTPAPPGATVKAGNLQLALAAVNRGYRAAVKAWVDDQLKRTCFLGHYGRSEFPRGIDTHCGHKQRALHYDESVLSHCDSMYLECCQLELNVLTAVELREVSMHAKCAAISAMGLAWANSQESFHESRLRLTLKGELH